MMLWYLLKKDILIIKKYVLIMLAAAVLIPPFMLWRVPEYAGILGFMLSVIFCVLILLQYISLKEYQFPKAASLLCAATFSRKMMVLSLYIFCIAVYVVCCTIYTIEALIIPGLDTMNAAMFFLMFLVTSVLISIYLPIQYKLGYEKTKFAFTVVIIVSPASAHENGKFQPELSFRIFPNPYLRKCLVAFLYDSGNICCFVHKIL